MATDTPETSSSQYVSSKGEQTTPVNTTSNDATIQYSNRSDKTLKSFYFNTPDKVREDFSVLNNSTGQSFDTLVTQVGSLGKDLAYTVDICKKLKNENASLQKNLRSLRKEHVVLREKSTAIRKSQLMEKQQRYKIETKNEGLVKKWRADLESKLNEFQIFEERQNTAQQELKEGAHQTLLDTEERYRSIIDSMRTDLSNQKVIISSLSDENKNLRKHISEADEDSEKGLTLHNEQNQKELSAYQTKLNTLEKENLELKTNACVQSFHPSEFELKKLKMEASSLKRNLFTKDENFHKELSSLLKERNELIATISKSNLEAAELRANIAHLTEDVSGAKDREAKLVLELEKSIQDYNLLLQEKNDLLVSNNDLKIMLEEEKLNLNEKLQRTNSVAEERNKILSEEVDRLSKLLATTQANVNAETVDSAHKFEQGIEASRKMCNQLTLELKLARQTENSNQERIRKLTAELNAIRTSHSTEVKTLKENVDELSERNLSIVAREKKLIDEEKTNCSQIVALMETKTLIQLQNKDLLSENEQLNEKLIQLQKSHEAIKRENVMFNQKLSQIEDYKKKIQLFHKNKLRLRQRFEEMQTMNARLCEKLLVMREELRSQKEYYELRIQLFSNKKKIEENVEN